MSLVACPTVRWVSSGFTFAPCCKETALCLPSCSLMTGSPAARAMAWKRRVTTSGRHGEPSPCQKIRPWSCHASPANWRSSSWTSRCLRSRAIVSSSSQTTRCPALVFGVDSCKS
jgi:hypothetical protein